MRTLPRGIRNNNPGNIDFNKLNNWRGQVGIETGVENPRFAKFDMPENGIRAIAKLLITYHNKGFRSVKAMINRWAPPVENDTGAYSQAVARKMEIDENQTLTISAYMLTIMVTAIIQHENGYQPYDAETIRRGVVSALK